jgi:hypothetical protein
MKLRTIDRYKFHVQPLGFDPYPNNFKCWVRVHDRATGKLFSRRGYGKFIGNFSPIWITIDGVSKQLSQWEREQIAATDGNGEGDAQGKGEIDSRGGGGGWPNMTTRGDGGGVEDGHGSPDCEG